MSHRGTQHDALSSPLELYGCTVDLVTGTVRHNTGESSRLTTRDLQLLCYITANNDRDVSRGELLREVWDYSELANTRATDNAMRRLRAKLETDPNNPRHLLTVRGVGYRFVGMRRSASFFLGETLVELAHQRVVRDGKPQTLSRREARLLSTLHSAAGEVVDRATLHKAGWQTGESGRALELAVRRLRQKIEVDPTNPRHLCAANAGFRLRLHRPTTRLRPLADRFVGRIAELQRLRAELTRPGIVTIKGSGGVGKTRLARQAALGYDDGDTQRAWFCELSACVDREAVVRSVARTLGIKADTDGPEQIGYALAGRGEVLLVLDNFEHLVHCAPIVEKWREIAPHARFLITSRERLRLRGERIVELAGLSEEEAVQLMIERAELGGTIVKDNAELRALAHSLERVPLALELAAARLGLLDPTQVRDRVLRHLDLLRREVPDRPARHSSLGACLQWSLNLCSPDERAALGQLAVFRGGLTVDAAEAVLRVEEPIVDLIQSLVDKSLVSVADQRLDMLDTIRRGATLEDADGPATELRHATYYASLGSDETIDLLRGPQGARHRIRTSADLENLLIACQRAIRLGDPASAVGTLRAAWTVLEFGGPIAHGERLAQQVLEMSALTASGAAHCLRIRARALHKLGRFEVAIAGYLAAQRAFAESGMTRWVAVVGVHLGNTHRQHGCPRLAVSALEAALEIYKEIGDRTGEVEAQASLGLQYGRWPSTDPDFTARRALATPLLNRALHSVRQSGDRHREGLVLCFCAVTALFGDGDHERARASYEAALVVNREVGNHILEATALGDLGVLCSLQGDFDAAVAYTERAVELKRRAGARFSEARYLANLGEMEEERGNAERAVLLYEQALEKSPDNLEQQAEIWGRLAAALWKQGDTQRAIPLFDDSEAQLREIESPDLAYVLATHASACLLVGKDELALRKLEEAESRVTELHAAYVASVRARVTRS